MRGFEEAGRVPYWVNCGNYVLTEEAIERFPDKGDHESSTFPELARRGRLRAYRHEGLWLTVNTPKELRVAQEHSSRIRSGSGRERIAPMDSPNLASLDRWGFDVRRVEKPWGHELIWALTDTYCGKVLFVRAGHSLSLQFHREKDESWLVQSGRAKLELGDAGQAALARRSWAPATRSTTAPAPSIG